MDCIPKPVSVGFTLHSGDDISSGAWVGWWGKEMVQKPFPCSLVPCLHQLQALGNCNIILEAVVTNSCALGLLVFCLFFLIQMQSK